MSVDFSNLVKFPKMTRETQIMDIMDLIEEFEVGEVHFEHCDGVWSFYIDFPDYGEDFFLDCLNPLEMMGLALAVTKKEMLKSLESAKQCH